MTPNNSLHRIQAVQTHRSAASTLKASRIDHSRIANAIARTGNRGTFSLLLEGNALAPHFEEGDRLILSSDAHPLPGDTVLANIAGKFGCMRINADGDLWDPQGGFVPQGAFSVAGVVVGRRKRAGRKQSQER